MRFANCCAWPSSSWMSSLERLDDLLRAHAVWVDGVRDVVDDRLELHPVRLGEHLDDLFARLGLVVREDALRAVSCLWPCRSIYPSRRSSYAASGPSAAFVGAGPAARAAGRARAPRAGGRSRSRPRSPAAFALEAPRRAHQILPARARGVVRPAAACGPATRRPADRRAAATSRRGGGSAPRARRARESAVETVGRRAPTSWPRMRWVSASGTITPSPDTRPQRSARCQNSAFRRRSTRVSCEIAWVVASRSERSLRRSNSDAVISGYRRHLGREAAIQHGDGQRRQDRPDGVDGQQPGAAGGLPGAHQIARAEQLRAHVVRHDELT